MNRRYNERMSETAHKVWIDKSYYPYEVCEEWLSLAPTGALSTPELVLRAYRNLSIESQEKVLLYGLSHLLGTLRTSIFRGAIGLPKGCLQKKRERDNARAKANSRCRSAKATQFDRAIEALAPYRIGDKSLEDCTQADFLRAAVSAEQEAGGLTATSVLYRGLADLLTPNSIVRISPKRGKILKVLTSHFMED